MKKDRSSGNYITMPRISNVNVKLITNVASFELLLPYVPVYFVSIHRIVRHLFRIIRSYHENQWHLWDRNLPIHSIDNLEMNRSLSSRYVRRWNMHSNIRRSMSNCLRPVGDNVEICNVCSMQKRIVAKASASSQHDVKSWYNSNR
jgi:hypothetical protein